MSYAVVWNPQPTTVIDEAWLAGSERRRQRLESSVKMFHSLVDEGPLQVGESRRSMVERIVVLDSLVIRFRVLDRIRIVRVFAVTIFDAK